MKRKSQFTSQEQEQQAPLQQQAQQQTAKQFASAEEMLRHDALHTIVPPSIARRLDASIQQTTPPATPWWRRLLDGS
jgi:hypothetical protein